eukprot:gene11318-21508_t
MQYLAPFMKHRQTKENFVLESQLQLQPESSNFETISDEQFLSTFMEERLCESPVTLDQQSSKQDNVDLGSDVSAEPLDLSESAPPKKKEREEKMTKPRTIA